MGDVTVLKLQHRLRRLTLLLVPGHKIERKH
jgi:hypothetical protein